MADRYDFSNIRVLIADGDDFMRETVACVLRSFGVSTIRECRDGAEAFEVMRSGPVDLVICDALMNPLDGMDFTRLARRAPDCREHDIPIIMLTGHSQQFRVLQARDFGVTEFLVKPVSPERLWRRIAHIIDEPRAFVEAPGYVGPDRRRRLDSEYGGPDRRLSVEISQSRATG